MENVYDIKIEKNLNFILPINSVKETGIISIEGQKILIIVHLHYPDTIPDYLLFLEKIPSFINVIITVSDEKVKEILLSAKTMKSRKKWKIVEKQNRGRDVSAILVSCRKEILKYDYVCFLHDKREKRNEYKNDIKIWIRCLWENMIGSTEYIENIISLFIKTPDLGLLVPPFPVSEHFSMFYSDVWGSNYSIVEKLASKMELNCNLSIEKQPLTLGTVFWAKVPALKKLFEIDWKYEDFDEEPLKNDGTISHSIERILAYVAQDAGFNTGWVMTDRYAGELIEYTQDILRESFYRLDTNLGILKVSELRSFDIRLKGLFEFINKYEEFYIFGAGELGHRCLAMIRTRMKTPTAFLVSDIHCNSRSIDGIPVKELAEVKLEEKTGMIIALGDRYKEEALNLIRKIHPDFYNIYIYVKE